MDEKYRRKILENEELQEAVQESSHLIEELFYERDQTLRQARMLDEEILSDLEDSEDFSPFLSLHQELDYEESRMRYAYEDTFDMIIRERRRLEDEHEEIYQQMYDEMKQEEEQAYGQNGDQ